MDKGGALQEMIKIDANDTDIMEMNIMIYGLFSMIKLGNRIYVYLFFYMRGIIVKNMKEFMVIL